jgi:L-fuculose-phosphate aldolase
MLGKSILNKVPIIETNQSEWQENKEFVIAKNLKDEDIVIIRGIGVFFRSRDIREILKKAIILENSASIILNSQH